MTKEKVKEKAEVKKSSKTEEWFKENPAICRKCEQLPMPLANGTMLCACGVDKCKIK